MRRGLEDRRRLYNKNTSIFLNGRIIVRLKIKKGKGLNRSNLISQTSYRSH